MVGPWDLHVRASEVIKEQLAPLGIEVEIEAVEQAVYLEKWRGSDFTATVLGYSGHLDPDQYMDRLRSDGGSNYGKWADEHFDALADQGARTLDQEERKQIYWEAQRYLCEKSPMLFTFIDYAFDAMKQEVKGYDTVLFSWDYHLMRNIWLDR